MKGNAGLVDAELSRLATPTAQRRFLRTNIEMRTVGLGGEL